MLILRGYEQWSGISFLGDHFRMVARGRKLHVIVPVCVGSILVVLCCRALMCDKKLCFYYCVEILLVCYRVTDDLAEVDNLDADIPQEGAARPSSLNRGF